MAGDISTGLFAHWKMNDNAANTTVEDNIGGYNGSGTEDDSAPAETTPFPFISFLPGVA